MDGSSNVYVTEVNNSRIQKFNSTGTFITKWGSSAEFYLPWGIVVDELGNVYVSEFGNDRIKKFDSTGNFITKWGSSGIEDGNFYNPAGVTLDRSGNVYVADFFNDRIQKFSPTGVSAGFTISAISGNTNENGSQATFTVKLNTQPTYDVFIPISSSDTSEGTPSPYSLLFTSTNWNMEQTVTVTGVNDAVHNGNQAFTVILGVAVSDDPVYNGLDPEDVAVINEDVTHTITASAGTGGSISPSGVVTVNNGVSQTFTITANGGYHILDVKVDGILQGAQSTYTFNNIIANHIIEAIFEADKSSGDSKKGCFISKVSNMLNATFYINKLTNFRDKFLMPDSIGKYFTDFYYKIQ